MQLILGNKKYESQKNNIQTHRYTHKHPCAHTKQSLRNNIQGIHKYASKKGIHKYNAHGIMKDKKNYLNFFMRTQINMRILKPLYKRLKSYLNKKNYYLVLCEEKKTKYWSVFSFHN